MKNLKTKIAIVSFVTVTLFSIIILQAQTLTRGPYLQVGKQNSITIRWRTSAATNSKVTWGTSYIVSPGTYANIYTQDVATPTSHTSNTETDLIAMREKFIRILERYGVDLVLCGHSHGYERSYLLKGFYNTYASPLLDANFNAATYTATGNTQNAMYDGVTGNYKAFTYNTRELQLQNGEYVVTLTNSAGERISNKIIVR